MRESRASRHRRHGIVAAWPSAEDTPSPSWATRACACEVQVPPGEIEGRLRAQGARQLGRELKLPGFRRGKVPAPLVIQRIGREAVLEEAVRDTLSSWYSDAIESAGIVPVGDPQGRPRRAAAAGRRRSSSRSRSACCRRPSSASTRASRSGAASRRSPRSRSSTRSRPCASAWRACRPPSAPPATGDFVVVDYVGSLARRDAPTASRRGEPFEGGEGRDQLVELGSGNLIPGFEEGLLGAAAGETRDRRADVPRRLRQRGARRARGSLRDDRQGGQAQGAARARRGLRDRRRLRRPRGAARGHPRAPARGRRGERIEGEFRQAALDAAVAGAEVRAHPGADRGARARRCGSGCCTRSPTAGSRARPTCS